ncbi:MAG: hypothetical protein XD60_0982 [Acetothermia bacterium 64_32]|nr:MAG: hypothetical protein XD60_0982 [Acetothermia bacterium 64_32]
MRKTLAVLAAVLTLTTPAWTQGKLGVGGSFWGGSPVFDAFAEVAFGEATAMRFGAGTVFSGGGLAAFTLDATFLITLGLEAIQPYFGAGAGAFVMTGGGMAAGIFTVNGIAGVYLPLAEAFGVYGQMKFLGQVGGGGFVGEYLFSVSSPRG